MKEIRTERLLLRKFTLADAQPMFDNWASDTRVTDFLTWETNKKVEETEATLQQWVSQYENDDFYQWAITPLDSPNEPIGSISVVESSPSRQACEIGYALAYDYWGQGLMTEALEAVSRYLLEEVGFHRLECLHNVANPASGRVMEKAGFHYEGTLRQYSLHKGQWVDVKLYSLLADDLAKV